MNATIPQMSVLLPNIRSGWNTGAFFRTADSLGFDHVFLAGATPFPPHKEITKTALGADVFVPWTYFSSELDAVQEIKKRGIKLVAMELVDNAVDISQADFSTPACLVMGNEVCGVSEEILKECHQTIYIPMQGKKQSMNVSIAGGIGMWEMAKQFA